MLREEAERLALQRTQLTEQRGFVLRRGQAGGLGASGHFSESIGHAFAEVLHEAAHICLGTTEVIVVAGPDRERVVVAAQMPGVVFLQRVNTLKPVATAMQDQRGEQPRGAPIPIVVRVNRGELVVRQCGDDRHGQVARLASGGR